MAYSFAFTARSDKQTNNQTAIYKIKFFCGFSAVFHRRFICSMRMLTALL